MFSHNHKNDKRDVSEKGLTLIELIITLAIVSFMALVLSELFLWGEWNFLEDQSMGNTVNTSSYALHFVGRYLSNAGYGISNLNCQTLSTNLQNDSGLISGITVSQSTVASGVDSPVSITVTRSQSEYAGIPLGQLASTNSVSGNSLLVNQASSHSIIEDGDSLIIEFPQHTCALVRVSGQPVSTAPSNTTSIPYSTSNSGTDSLASLLPNLTSTDMDGATVYEMGNSSKMTTTTFSISQGTSLHPSNLDISVNGGQPTLLTPDITDMQVLFGYATSDSKAVNQYGPYDASYAQDIRTVSIALVARGRVKVASVNLPETTKFTLFPAINSTQSITGSTLPAIYYQPPSGSTHQQISVVRTTVPVMNQIW